MQAAESLGLTGWVKNERDGSVSCEAQGETGPLSEFAEALQRGPRFGSVRELEREELQPVEESRFEIR